MKKIIVVLLTLYLSACSSKFVYNNLDWLLYWYLDDYVELQGGQKTLFDQQLDKWLTWHRQQELVQYRQQLLELKQQLQQGGLTQLAWLAQFDRGRSHWVRLRERLTPELMPFATNLSDEQVNKLFTFLEEEDAERKEKREKTSAEERMAKSRKSMHKELKKWVGKTTAQQTEMIENYSEQFQTTFDEWQLYRHAMREQAKALFASRKTDIEFESKLIQLLRNPDEFKSPELLQKDQFNRELYAQLLADISQSLTTKQQRKLQGKLDDLIDDLTDLIED